MFLVDWRRNKHTNVKEKKINSKTKINQLLGARYGGISLTKAMDKIEASSETAGTYPINPVIKKTLK